MNKITSKTVVRWYLNGKGYANRKTAYKKLAYQYLLDEVLGEVTNGCRKNLRDARTSSEATALIDKLFAEKFPHGVDARCEGTCRKNYENIIVGGELDTKESGFAFNSCKAAQQTWVKNKAEELYEATRTKK